jgi:hypothetical protein
VNEGRYGTGRRRGLLLYSCTLAPPPLLSTAASP